MPSRSLSPALFPGSGSGSVMCILTFQTNSPLEAKRDLYQSIKTPQFVHFITVTHTSKVPSRHILTVFQILLIDFSCFTLKASHSSRSSYDNATGLQKGEVFTTEGCTEWGKPPNC